MSNELKIVLTYYAFFSTYYFPQSKEDTMKTLSAVLIFAVVLFLASGALAEKPSERGLHDMHMMMHMMDVGLCKAMEGSNLQMLGQTGISEKLDKDAMLRGTQMIKDGKALIKEMLEGEAMKALYKEGGFDKKVMDDLHKLGEKMLEVIEQAEKLHKVVSK